MDFMSETEITLPLSHLIVYIYLVAACFLYSRVNLGFTLNFLFVIYLGFIVNYSSVHDSLSFSKTLYGLYIVTGAVALLAFFFSLLKQVAEFPKSK